MLQYFEIINLENLRSAYNSFLKIISKSDLKICLTHDILNYLFKELKTKRYYPKPIKRINILNSKNQKIFISIPNIRDSILQIAIAKKFEIILTKNFSTEAFNFEINNNPYCVLHFIKNN